MKSALSRLLVWWHENEAIHLQARLLELDAEAKRIELDKIAVKSRLIKAELRQLQHAEVS